MGATVTTAGALRASFASIVTNAPALERASARDVGRDGPAVREREVRVHPEGRLVGVTFGVEELERVRAPPW